ncbi:MAG: adenylate kinase [Myxacorys chilensis ATA2-1-KO14]|jgi:adenylate kinase|nr:adenylate kinase [Myxacorys chilensis ATA2-1-KO14]
MRLILLGAPGAGKGTQSQQICQTLGLCSISTGDLLRSQIKQKTDLGKQIRIFVDQDELVPDEIVIELIRQRLLKQDLANGWLLEGYPRTPVQAEEFDALLAQLNQALDYVVLLDVPDEVLIGRSLNPARQDDQPEALQKRIEIFRDRTSPLLEYYNRQNRLVTVDGNQAIGEVREEILKKIGITEGNEG